MLVLYMGDELVAKCLISEWECVIEDRRGVRGRCGNSIEEYFESRPRDPGGRRFDEKLGGGPLSRASSADRYGGARVSRSTHVGAGNRYGVRHAQLPPVLTLYDTFADTVRNFSVKNRGFSGNPMCIV